MTGTLKAKHVIATAEDTDKGRSEKKGAQCNSILSTEMTESNNSDLPTNMSVLNYAEILYRCTLCRSIPSILTCEETFRSHMRTKHLPGKDKMATSTVEGHSCRSCGLRLITEEDCQYHVTTAHPRSDSGFIAADGSLESIRESKQRLTSGDNEAARSLAEDSNQSNSSLSPGMNCGNFSDLTLKCAGATPNSNEEKRGSKTVLDLEDKKSSTCGRSDQSVALELIGVAETNKFKPSDKNHQTSSESLCRLQELTDQIMACTRTVMEKPKPGNGIKQEPWRPTLPLPGFTREFGKYTKLVREGGNIVYFCQVCNWKSPSKPDFQTHCSGHAHLGRFNLISKSDDNCNSRTSMKGSQKEQPDAGHGHSKCGKVEKDPRELLSSKHSRGLGCPGPVCLPFRRFWKDCERTDVNDIPLNLADRPGKQKNTNVAEIKTDVTEVCTESESGVTKQTYPNPVTEDKISFKSKSDTVLDNSSGNADKILLHRRRRKRPAPMKVRNQCKDGRFDWSDCSSSTGSDDDDSRLRENRKRARLAFNDAFSLNADGIANIAVSGCQKLQVSMRGQTDEIHASPSDESSDSVLPKNDNSNLQNEHPDTLAVNMIKQEPQLELSGVSCQEMQEKCYRNDDNGTDSGDNIENDGMRSSNGEGWKIIRIKEVLSEILCESPKANIARDLLLQTVSHVLRCPEVAHWGPACNRAVREEFPNSIAQRKGKFKKTYFFGVQFAEQTTETNHVIEGDAFSFQPLRDMSLDTEKILQYLPDLVCWTGDLEFGVSRDELLQLLAEPIADSNVLVWGIECNRAVRKLFPDVHTKRKGKYKTVFYGLSYRPHVRQEHMSKTHLKSRSPSFAEICPRGLHYYSQDVLGISLKMAPPDHYDNCEKDKMAACIYSDAVSSPVDLKETPNNEEKQM